jgi:hypothetical protein
LLATTFATGFGVAALSLGSPSMITAGRSGGPPAGVAAAPGATIPAGGPAGLGDSNGITGTLVCATAPPVASAAVREKESTTESTGRDSTPGWYLPAQCGQLRTPESCRQIREKGRAVPATLPLKLRLIAGGAEVLRPPLAANEAAAHVSHRRGAQWGCGGP